MPYIDPRRRSQVVIAGEARTAGELNFAITKLILAYAIVHANYQGINDVIGALEGAKAEFQRRFVAPYEDKKILENGDIYT